MITDLHVNCCAHGNVDAKHLLAGLRYRLSAQSVELITGLQQKLFWKRQVRTYSVLS